MITFWDIVGRSEKGPFVKEEEFDWQIGLLARQFAQKYDIRYDPEQVIAADDDPITGNLPPGIYTIYASICNGVCYSYDVNYSGYILSVTNDGLTYTVSDMANDMGISLSTLKAKAMPWIQFLLLGE